MKRYWSGVAMAGMLAATAVVGAQGQSPANTPPPDSAAQPGVQRAPAPPSAQSRTPNTLTVTGCIQNAPMASAATDQADRGQARDTNAQGRTPSGNASASGQSGARFVLGSARMSAGGDAPRSAVGTTGTAMTTYQLEGQTADVSKYVNHQVEITGTLQSSAASATGSASAAQGATAVGPTLRVTSVRMLSTTCEVARTPGTTGSTTPGPNDSSTSPEGQTSPSGGNPSGVPSEPRPNEPGPSTRP